jgi:hypothetical protein
MSRIIAIAPAPMNMSHPPGKVDDQDDQQEDHQQADNPPTDIDIQWLNHHLHRITHTLGVRYQNEAPVRTDVVRSAIAAPEHPCDLEALT